MKPLNYIVVSEEEGLYDTVMRQINEEIPDARIRRAGTVREGVAILEKTGSGIILTDLKDFECHRNTMRFPWNRENEEAGQAPDDSLAYIPETFRGNTKADLGLVKRYIRMHLEEDLSLDTLSRMACLSPNYLSSLFKKREGESLKKYIERQRIERAAYLLLTEDSMMSEIAVRVGYRYCSYFCSVFKEYYGVSPLQFRLKNREQKKRKEKTI